jgi:hypothetical protein
MNKHSTILLRSTTREHLKQIGKKGQTYDEIIDNLLRTNKTKKHSLDSRLVALQSSESAGQ